MPPKKAATVAATQPKFQLRRGGYAIRKSQISQKEKKLIMKELNVTPRTQQGLTMMMAPQPFPIYRESLTRFYVPRHFGFETFGAPISDVLPRGTQCPNLVFEGSLRPKQKPVINIFKKSKGGGVISVPCGFGKTCCAIYLACWLKRKTLVVVHKNFLLSQWVERIQQFAPKARIGRIQGKVVDVEDKDIVIGMLQSLSMKDYEPTVFKEFGFTVIDECFPRKQNIITQNGTVSIGTLYDMWKSNRTSLPLVKTYNLNTQQFEFKEITYAWEKPNKYNELIHIKAGRNIYKSTPNHKYLTTEGWKCACDLSLNDVLISGESSNIVINKIWKETSNESVYDIEVKDNHNFIICGSGSSYGPVVHNCHHISAEVFSRALPILGSRWNLGLSATPDRNDGLSKVFYWHLGPLLYPKKSDIQVRPDTEAEEHSTQCIVKKIEYTHDDPTYSQEPMTAQGKPNTARMITQVCEWHRRNLLILEILLMCMQKQRVVLVLSDRRQMLDNLEEMIRRKFHGVTVGQYVGGMKQKVLDQSAKCDIILSTYAMSSEGMDIPRINTVVLASPKSNVEQSVGRAQRKLHDHGVWLFDIVDMFSMFPRQWERRKAFYRKFVSTDSYKKQRYPIEIYRINDQHDKPLDLLRDALNKPFKAPNVSTKKEKTTHKDKIDMGSKPMFLEET